MITKRKHKRVKLLCEKLEKVKGFPIMNQNFKLNNEYNFNLLFHYVNPRLSWIMHADGINYKAFRKKGLSLQ